MTSTPASRPKTVLPSFDEFLHGVADNICAALELLVEQADGVRPMRYADLIELGCVDGTYSRYQAVLDAMNPRIERKRRQLQELWVQNLHAAFHEGAP